MGHSHNAVQETSAKDGPERFSHKRTKGSVKSTEISENFPSAFRTAVGGRGMNDAE